MKVTVLDPFYLEGEVAEEAFFRTRGGSNWIDLAGVKEKMELALRTSDVAILEVRGSFRNSQPSNDRPRREDYEYDKEARKGCYIGFHLDKVEKILDIIWEELHGYECVGIDNCVYVDQPAYLLELMFQQCKFSNAL